MTFGVVSGFAPVNGTQSVAIGAAGQKTAPQDSPVGMFEALLALVGTKLPEVTAVTPVNSSQSEEAQQAQTSLAALVDQAVAASASAKADVAAPATATTSSASASTENSAQTAPAVLTSLVDQLTALQDVIGGSAPVDPAVEKKLTKTIEALAAALGIELPQAPTDEAAITTAATATAATIPVLDPLATIEATAATAPATQLAQAAATTTTSATPAPGALAVPPTVTAATAAAPATATATATTTTTGQLADGAGATASAKAGVQATAEVAQPVPAVPAGSEKAATPVVKELADKLKQLATVLSPKMPELGKKLEALAGKLTSGEVDPEMLAKLGLNLDVDADLPDTEIARAIDRLLAPRAETKAAPAPVPFATASLALPDLGAAAAGKTDATAETKTANAPAPQLDAEPEPDTDVIQTAQRTPERADKLDAQPPQRNSFNTTFQASLAADAATQPGNPATAPASVLVGSAVAADAKAMHAAYRVPVQQINVPQMAIEIVRQVEAGNSRFQIRLDPPELGRIDVKLDVDKAGNVSARMTVERAETLDLMQRDQRSLEKALAQAGLDSSKTNLEFSLRQNPSGREGQQQQGGDSSQPSFPRFGAAEADEVPAPHITAYRGYASASGVNLFI